MPMIKDPRWSAINFDGTPAAGAKMYVYEAGTDILSKIYTDDTQTTVLENPLIADGYGFFPVAYLSTGDYKVRIENANGALISQVNNVSVSI
jgi:hypothetical protein